MGIFVVNIPPFSLCSFKMLTMQMKSVLLACGLHSIIDVSELQFLALNCSENTWLFQDRNTAGVFLALWTITVPYETSYPPPIPTYTHRQKHSVTPPIPLLSHNRHTPTYTIYVRTPTHRQTHVHTNPNPSTWRFFTSANLKRASRLAELTGWAMASFLFRGSLEFQIPVLCLGGKTQHA